MTEKYLPLVDFHGHRHLPHFWLDRVWEMARAMTTSNHGFGYSPISDIEVDEGWPLGDTEIRFTRDNDGARIRLYLDCKRWVGEEIK